MTSSSCPSQIDTSRLNFRFVYRHVAASGQIKMRGLECLARGMVAFLTGGCLALGEPGGNDTTAWLASFSVRHPSLER